MPESGNFLIHHLVAILCIWFFMADLAHGRVCYRSYDIRNHPNELNKLQNCTTVTGSVSIILIETANQTLMESYSFPDLREIHGYLLMFRVFGLTTLSHLFPNLTVIRGHELFHHYGLILYEMNDLREIGLNSLMDIQHGFVMIRYCPNLCFVQTINWDLITEETMSGGVGNYLNPPDYDKKPVEIVVCPSSLYCPIDCPLRHCWSENACQRVEIDEGFSRLPGNETCHAQCLGGCTIPNSPSNCYTCRHLKSRATGQCITRCPKNEFILGGLCVSKEFCEDNGEMVADLIEGECRNICPQITLIDGKSTDDCARNCPAFEILSLADSALFRGCERIRGHFHIKLRSGGPNTMQVLKRNLGKIEEIDGTLKIYRSPVITSLSFLKNLNLIRGLNTENSHDNPDYSFILMSNQNLQELWNFNEKRLLELQHGNIQIHDNSKLCLDQIDELQEVMGTNKSKDFISTLSNGYQQTCRAQTITTKTRVLSSTTVIVDWTKVRLKANEKVAGYIIFYIPAPFQNVSHFGVDSCLQYAWQTHYVMNATEKLNHHQEALQNLNQNTQYAYYIKTEVVLKNDKIDTLHVRQGQSDIHYFQTLPELPRYPYVSTISKTNTSIKLAWENINDNDEIHGYHVDVFIQREDQEFMGSRDYCKEPITKVDNVAIELQGKNPIIHPTCQDALEDWKQYNPDSRDPKRDWLKAREEYCRVEHMRKTKEEEDDPEDLEYLKKHVMSDDVESLRFSRHVHHLVSSRGENAHNKSEPHKLGNDYLYSREYNDVTDRTDTFEDLLPYTMYIFQYFACNSVGCGPYNFHFERTASSIYADTVSLKATVAGEKNNDAHLEFTEPENPNGLTVAFNIEQIDVNHSNVTTICITQKQHRESGHRYIFTNLENGEYKYRVRAISLAMDGSYAEDDVQVNNLPFTYRTKRMIVLVVISVGIFILCTLYVHRRHNDIWQKFWGWRGWRNLCNRNGPRNDDLNSLGLPLDDMPRKEDDPEDHAPGVTDDNARLIDANDA